MNYLKFLVLIMSDKIIKNPFNYSGSKNRILPLIQENLPDRCNIIAEPFAGTFEVSLNNDFGIKLYNDKNYYLYNMIQLINDSEIDSLINYLRMVIKHHNLSKFDKESYYKFREYFNKEWKDFLKSHGVYKDTAFMNLLALIYYSFNYYWTFDKDGRYINTSGYKKSWFNPSLERKLRDYSEALKSSYIEFDNLDFRSFFNKVTEVYNNNLGEIFWFIDPPYINSDSIYDRTSELKYTKQDEEDLYSMLYEIDKHGGKFMLTNTIECNGVCNDLLHVFSKNFNVIDTQCDFYNCSYQRKNNKTKEIIVKNY